MSDEHTLRSIDDILAKAADARRKAAVAKDDTLRTGFLTLAKQWDDLAEHRKRMTAKAESRPPNALSKPNE